jgi:mitochondrial fission protein ELM1
MFARSASSQKKARAEAPATAGLLVGANTAAVRYRDQDWSLLIDFLRRLQASRGTRWIVSNSRRTPRRLTGRFARLAEEAQSPVASFIDVRTAGSGTLLPLFANSDAVIATVDSSSMVSEAIWARRPVIAVAPAETRLSDAEQEYRAFLEAQGWLRTIAISDLKIERVLAALSEMKPLNANPLDLLAETLFERLPGLLESPSR